jgi:uncharacterized protein (TIGR04222 family)
MGWLFDNVLANMPGPDFLKFYAICAGVVLTAAYLFIATQDTTGGRPPPAIAGVIDPYEIAYLRGGTNEVIRAAAYALWQRGVIELAENAYIRPAHFTVQDLTPIEREVLDTIAPAPKVAGLFSDKSLRLRLERLCGDYERRLSAEQLLTPPEARRAARRTLFVAGGLLIALAGYKLAAAAAHGRSNVGFLVVEAALVCFALLWGLGRVNQNRASRRGKAYLAQIQLAYSDRLRAVKAANPESVPGQSVLGGSALLMIGLFGLAALQDTAEAPFAKAFAQSSGSGGDGGGSCGGGDGGGGGGCGGCGGGGGD